MIKTYHVFFDQFGQRKKMFESLLLTTFSKLTTFTAFISES